jgi:hypothetical protein
MATLYCGNLTLVAEVTLVAPALAQRWLTEAEAAGAINRKETNVERYGLDMKNKKWFLSGQPIIFNDKGLMTDGFNRCKACVASQSTFPVLVVRGIDSRAFDVIDTGKTRSLADLLTMKFSNEDDKIKYVSVVSYVAKRIVCIENDRPVSSTTPTTRVEEMQAVRKHRNDVEEAATLSRTKFVTSQPSLMAFLYWYYVILLRKPRSKQFFSDYAEVSSYSNLSDASVSSYIKGSSPVAETLYTFFNGKNTKTKKEALINAVAAIEHFISQKPVNKTIAQIRQGIVDVTFTKTGVIVNNKL